MPCSRSLLFLIFCLQLLLAAVLPAATLIQITETADLTQASISAGQVITYSVSYSNSSLTLSALSGKIETVLDARLVFLGTSTTSHIQTAAYDSATRKVTFNFVSPLPAGAVGTVTFSCQFASNTP